MDDFQQYNNALQQSVNSIARPDIKLSNNPVLSQAQEIGRTVLETFGQEIIRETLTPVAKTVRRSVLKRIGFSDEDVDSIDEKGFRKGLKDIYNKKIKSKIESVKEKVNNQVEGAEDKLNNVVNNEDEFVKSITNQVQDAGEQLKQLPTFKKIAQLSEDGPTDDEQLLKGLRSLSPNDTEEEINNKFKLLNDKEGYRDDVLKTRRDLSPDDIENSRQDQIKQLKDVGNEEFDDEALTRGLAGDDDVINIATSKSILKDPQKFKNTFDNPDDLSDESIEDIRQLRVKKYMEDGKKLLKSDKEEDLQNNLESLDGEIGRLQEPAITFSDGSGNITSISRNLVEDQDGLRTSLTQRGEIQNQLNKLDVVPESERPGDLPVRTDQIEPETKPPIEPTEQPPKNISDQFGPENADGVENRYQQSLREQGEKPIEQDIGQTVEGDVGRTVEGDVEKTITKTATKDLIETTGEEGGSELLGGFLDATGFLAPIGAAIGIGALIGGLFLHKNKHHSSQEPENEPRINPSVQFGVQA